MNDGGPAFPMPDFTHPNGQVEHGVHGMSVRDYFAAHAMQPLITEGLRLDHESWQATAAHAYIIADAMLAERSRS